jgi:hypothetical protein
MALLLGLMEVVVVLPVFLGTVEMAEELPALRLRGDQAQAGAEVRRKIHHQCLVGLG